MAFRATSSATMTCVSATCQGRAGCTDALHELRVALLSGIALRLHGCPIGKSGGLRLCIRELPLQQRLIMGRRTTGAVQRLLCQLERCLGMLMAGRKVLGTERRVPLLLGYNLPAMTASPYSTWRA